MGLSMRLYHLLIPSGNRPLGPIWKRRKKKKNMEKWKNKDVNGSKNPNLAAINLLVSVILSC
jgi:hypothetical protein